MTPAPPQTPASLRSGTRRSSVSEIGSGTPGFEWSSGQETLRVEPWGPDAVRVRGRVGPVLDGLPGALDDEPEPSQAKTEVTTTSARLVNGRVTADLTTDVDAHGQGMLRFTSTATGEELLAEQPIHWWWPGPRMFAPMGNGYHRLEQSFRAYEGERLYGLGQHGHGLLDQKGTVLDLVQRNGEVTVPFVLSSRGYGLLWNNPAIGRVELAGNGTRWVADSARQIDYWVTAGTPAEILGRYADASPGMTRRLASRGLSTRRG